MCSIAYNISTNNRNYGECASPPFSGKVGACDRSLYYLSSISAIATIHSYQPVTKHDAIFSWWIPVECDDIVIVSDWWMLCNITWCWKRICIKCTTVGILVWLGSSMVVRIAHRNFRPCPLSISSHPLIGSITIQSCLWLNLHNDNVILLSQYHHLRIAKKSVTLSLDLFLLPLFRHDYYSFLSTGK